MRDRVEQCQGLDPLRHRLDRRQPSGQHRERRVDEEADELALVVRAGEGRDEGAQPDSREDAARAGGEHKGGVAPKRDVEHQPGHHQHEGDHRHEQDEERHDLGRHHLERAGRRHQELLDRAALLLADHRGRGHELAIQDDEHAEHPGDDEPRVHQARVVEERRPQLEGRRPRPRTISVEKGDGALHVTLGDLRGVRVCGVEEHLDGGGPSARTPPGEVVGHHHPDVQPALGEVLPEQIRGRIGAGQAKRGILREHRDQLAALVRAALVDDAELQVPDVGVQGEAEQ